MFSISNIYKQVTGLIYTCGQQIIQDCLCLPVIYSEVLNNFTVNCRVNQEKNISGQVIKLFAPLILQPDFVGSDARGITPLNIFLMRIVIFKQGYAYLKLLPSFYSQFVV